MSEASFPDIRKFGRCSCSNAGTSNLSESLCLLTPSGRPPSKWMHMRDVAFDLLSHYFGRFIAGPIPGGVMSIYEAIGMAWVIFTSAIGTVEILYLAFVGLKPFVKRDDEVRDSDVPVEVKEMFKIAR